MENNTNLYIFEGNEFSKMKENHIHFIGIGGISMSSLAHILLHNGKKVSGSDMTRSHLTDELEKMGAKISIGQSKGNIENPDLVVYTAAISDDNEELKEARRKNIKTIERAVLLGEIMKKYPVAIAVSGTHGKTTTTSMITHVLLENEADPTVTVGGELNAISGNLRLGRSDYFLTEACEYHRSFLKFFPKIGIILNIEADHLDYFKDLDEIVDTFCDFAALIPEDGTLIIANDNPNTIKTVSHAKCKVITCGLNDADFTAKNIEFDKNGYPSFDVFHNGESLTRITLSVNGKHNIYNALCAFACGYDLGFNIDLIKKGLLSFGGTKRRFEKKGEVFGFTIVDDYAHHPTEIKATLKAAKNAKYNKVWCIFQPHTYTRTKALLNDFSKALAYADNIIITDIYAAREKDTGLVSAKDLADITEGSVYIKEFEDIKDYIIKNAKEGDLVITMGAGTVYKIGEMIIDETR